MLETIGRYRVVRQLGKGGMGEVYLAEDPNLHRQVALKVLLDVDAKARRRFVQEAITASKLSHPNVAVVYEAGESDSTAFIAMQYVEGETLRDRLGRGAMQLDEIVRIGAQIADALDDAHRRGVVHRDIKPGNIMIDTRGHAKVLDFGIAKLIELEQLPAADESTAVAATTKGTFLGTLQYVSPEQAAGGAVDGRTDIFSLGVVLYEMVTGSNPFAAPNFLATLQRIRELKPAPIQPAELNRIVMKCLEKDPARRYQTARDLALDLENVRTGVSQPPSKPGRLRSAVALSSLIPIAIAAAWFLTHRNSPRPAPRAAGIESIAVLPFVNFSPDRQNDYIGDGITEAVIDGLAQLKTLNVVSRTSVFAFKGTRSDIREVGRSLGVDAVVEGSVQRSGSKLRVTAQLIKTHDGYHLWSHTYDGVADDVFSIEDQIARSVAKALERTINRSAAVPSTRDVAAYELYVRARHEERFQTRRNFENAVAAFRAAIERDPNFAEAYAGLAEAYSLADHRPGVTTLTPADTYRLAIESANRALNIDPDSAEAHSALAHIDLHLGLWVDAKAHIDRALQINANLSNAHLWRAVILRTLGDYAAAQPEASRAEQLDPLSPLIPMFWSTNAWMAGDYQTALRAAQHGIAIEPQYGEMYANLARAQLMMNQFDAADAALRHAAQFGSTNVESSRALMLAMAGRRDEAVGLLRSVEKHAEKQSPYWMMRAWAAAGNVDEAIRWMRRMVDETPYHGRINADLPPHPAFAQMRSDPRYVELRRKLQLPVE